MNIPFIYLGLPIGGTSSKASFWDPVITKVMKRLSIWKGKNLSFADRVCLIRSVLNVIPLYYLSFFKAPSSICKKIIKLDCKFLWGWDSEWRKIARIKWDNICKPKVEGWLGIMQLHFFNKALLGKQKWRLGSMRTIYGKIF